ncbi:PREDICTED: uncharacterized protein LOC109216913 [Nicotiana attenuata]|uniref:uncharacterized protein LOC109216913 n=1 Tax=Nicotiana attenuata TaxID=49451 RepID=UPI000905779F|nr:PREDICTED: uncharacterized protein LOC109216913 [Nicotiana attenuata]
MEIHNDMGYRVYVELKKENREFGMYPLCVTTIEKELIDGAVQRYDSDSDNTLAIEFVNSGEAIGVFELHKDLIISKTNQKDVMAGQVYKDKATLKEVMENYAIAQRFQFRVDRSNAVNYALLCISEDCEWRFKASSINKSELFKVREFNDNHTCPLKDKVYEQRQASSSLIGGIIRPTLTNHKRKYTPRDIIDDVKSDLGVDVSYMLAWRAKEKAMNFLRGEPADSYKKLPGYLYTMDMTYPGSHIRMLKSPKNEFMYVYISLYAFIRGFDHCRPIVVVDGSHLKSYYTGTFVSASTLDGAGHILPLAYGVIDSENDAAWTWFFEQFKIAYGVRENMCIISDRNKSIIKSVSRGYPDVPHFACIWNLWNNVYKKFKKSHAKLSEIYFSMAKAYTEAEFDSLMEKVEKVDIRVKEYLELAGYEKWARLYAPVNRGWTMTSNIAESINAALVSARELPIYDFLEEVRKMFGRWNCSNCKEATQTYKTLGKKYQEMLELNERMCTRMTVVPSNEYLHTVNDGGRNYTVCLLERKCVCGRFQIDELPCPHAWAVLKSKFLMPEEYCSNYYKPSTIVMTYDVPVYPLPDKNDWNIPEHVAEEVVLPPKWKRPPGRPKKKRDKTLSELLQPKNQHSCSICGQGGHNKRTCRNAPRNK